jgi:hypothetical protein
MGGCIGLRTLLERADFCGAVFSAPMWHLQMKAATRELTAKMTRLANLVGLGQRLMPGTRPQPTAMAISFAGNPLTSDAAVFASIGALWKARVNGTQGEANPDHRILYSRFNGTSWTSTYLVRGGEKLYDSEQDYVGGAALDPDDPHVIYVSTPFDPRNDTTNVGQHEIWKGVTCNDGASFTWTPITMNSAVDNLRPVVPKWDTRNTALLWFRGTYQTAQIYDEEVVGIVTQR